MGSSLVDIKKRIDSTRATQHLTNAMQMVSAAKLSKSEQKAKKYHSYTKSLHYMVAHLSNVLKEQGKGINAEEPGFIPDSFIDFHDLLLDRPIKKTGYLVISSDQGLAGSYNSSLFQSMLRMLEDDHQSKDEYVLMTIGNNAYNYFKKLGLPVDYKVAWLSDQPTFQEVQEIIVKAVQLFRQGYFDVFYVCYNHHVNAMHSLFRIEKMLPLTDLDDLEVEDEAMANTHYLIEPSIEDVLSQLLPQYAQALIYEAIIDAKTAEHAARMVAMRSASDNAEKLIERLQKEYNQGRQSAITQELTEIMGGAVVLEKKDD